VTRRECQEPNGWFLTARESKTGEELHAQVVVGADFGYGRNHWGLPGDLLDDALWHLARIEPRKEAPKARGGTIAILRQLTAWADDAGVWLITEIMPENSEATQLVIDVVSKYGGFEPANLELGPRLLKRPPPS